MDRNEEKGTKLNSMDKIEKSTKIERRKCRIEKKWTNQIWFKFVTKALMFKMDSNVQKIVFARFFCRKRFFCTFW